MLNLISLYKNWYKQFYSYGSETVAYIPKKDINRLGVTQVQLFYKGYLIPMLLIASKSKVTNLDSIYSTIEQQTKTYQYKVGDDSRWQDLAFSFNIETEAINDVIQNFNKFDIGNAWMFVLQEFIKFFSPEDDDTIEFAMQNAWIKFKNTIDVRIAWKGPNHYDSIILCNKNTLTPIGLFGPVLFVYPSDYKLRANTHYIQDILTNDFYSYTTDMVQIVQSAILQTPIFKLHLPKQSVPILQNNKEVIKEVSIQDCGSPGVPPIEVLYEFRRQETEALLKEYKSHFLMLYKVMETGLNVPKVVSNYMHTLPVMNHIKSLTQETSRSEVTVEQIDVYAPVEVPTHEVVKYVENTERLDSLQQTLNDLQDKYNKLKTDYDALEDKNDELIKNNKNQERRIKELLDKQIKDEEQINQETTEESIFKDLIENDPYYSALDYVCKYWRLSCYRDNSPEHRDLLKRLTPVIIRLSGVSYKEKRHFMINSLERYKVGSAKEVCDILDGAIKEIT